MSRILFLAVAAVIAILPSVGAAQDTAKVKRLIEARLGGKVEAVEKTPYLGLYEVHAGRQVIYTDENVTYFFVGNIVDAKTRENLTEQRMEALSAIDWKDLPLGDAVKTVRGKGTRQVAVFADPNCPYCKRFEQQMSGMDDVTIYTFLYPILSPDSYDKAKAIWCSKDPSKAYYDLMLKGTKPPAGACETPLDKNLALGRKLGVDGTPTSFVESGKRVTGARFDAVQTALESGGK